MRCVKTEKRFKAYVALDPWLRAFCNEMINKEYESSTPTLILNSDGMQTGFANQVGLEHDVEAA